MKVLELNVKNFKKLKDLNIETKGQSVYILGKNGAGKTSIISALFAALTAEENIPEPITQGEDTGWVDVVIGDDPGKKYRINLRMTSKDKKGRLSVKTEDGANYASPKRFLEDLIGRVSYNPLTFISQKPKEQAKAILDVFGIDMTELENQHIKLYAERTEVGREAKVLAGFIQKNDMVRELADKTPDPDGKKDAKFIVNIAKQLVQSTEQEQVPIDQLQQRLRKLETEYRDRDKELNAIAQLEAENEKSFERIAYWEAEIKKERTAIAARNKTLEEKEEALIPDPMPEMEEVRDYMASAIKTNQKAQAVQQIKQSLDQLEEYEGKYVGLSKDLEAIQSDMKAAVKDIELMPGLEFTESGLIYNGLPINEHQLSLSERIKLGIAIGTLFNPKLKVVAFDATVLDRDSRAEVMELLKTEDYQAFIELVDSDTDELQIILEEDADLID